MKIATDAPARKLIFSVRDFSSSSGRAEALIRQDLIGMVNSRWIEIDPPLGPIFEDLLAITLLEPKLTHEAFLFLLDEEV